MYAMVDQEISQKWSHQIKAVAFKDIIMVCIPLNGSEAFMVIDSGPRQDVSWTQLLEHLIMDD